MVPRHWWMDNKLYFNKKMTNDSYPKKNQNKNDKNYLFPNFEIAVPNFGSAFDGDKSAKSLLFLNRIGPKFTSFCFEFLSSLQRPSWQIGLIQFDPSHDLTPLSVRKLWSTYKEIKWVLLKRENRNLKGSVNQSIFYT